MLKRRTNCVNCGGLIDTRTSRCPFCGTCYIDMDPADLSKGGKIVFRFDGKTMQGYITTFDMIDIAYDQRRDANGRIQRPQKKNIIRFAIVAGDVDCAEETVKYVWGI